MATPSVISITFVRLFFKIQEKKCSNTDQEVHTMFQDKTVSMSKLQEYTELYFRLFLISE